MPTAAEIAASLERAEVIGDPGVLIESVVHDSRIARPGSLFAAMRGGAEDGRRFIDDAVKKGATAIMVDEPVSTPVTEIVVPDVRKALGPAASVCYGRPTERLKVVGITGTNGKTTISYLVESAVREAGGDPGRIGTVEYRFGDKVWEAGHTTPEASVFQATAKEMLDLGATHLVIEASSHGLVLNRLNGCRFEVVAFTNLTQDHLDFHRDMKEYAAAKMLLFTRSIDDAPNARAAINIDDPFGVEIARTTTHPVVTVSCKPDSAADIRPASLPSLTIDGIEADAVTPNGLCKLSSKLIGEHNLSNTLVALGISVQLGIDPKTACLGISRVETVPGRLEPVKGGKGFSVLVDYAHTPDAISRALAALRPLTRSRLICVFGCGGDRDSAKRPLMGRAAADLSDLCVVTSDNPRTETPEAIIETILSGVEAAGAKRISPEKLAEARKGYAVEADRKKAIRHAVAAARPGDTVLVAGKGHEDYQILGKVKVHFDDREQVAEALAEIAGGGRG